MSTLICLGGGLEALPIIQRVKALGHTAVVVDGNPAAPAVPLADVFVQASCYHAEPTLAALRRTGLKPDGVLCCAIDAPQVAAEVAYEFGLPSISVDSAAIASHKLTFKRVLKKAGLPVPQFYAWDGKTSPRFDDCVVKPVDSRGARGVVRVSGRGAPVPAFEIAKAASGSGRVMVEEWIDGLQYSTESIVVNGRVLFTAVGLRNYGRLAEFAPYCIEDGFDAPMVVLTNEYDTLIQRACQVLGFNNCTVKGDLVRDENGDLHILELAPRLSGGFFATHGHLLAYGLPFVDYAIRLALGDHMDSLSFSFSRHIVCQRYVFPDPADYGRTVGYLQPLPLDLPSVFHSLAVTPGQIIRPVTSHADRWGQAMAIGNTFSEAKARATEAVRVLKESVRLL